MRATDADSGQKLTYTLTNTDNDADDFDIDWATGQLKTKAALDFEGTPTSYDRHRQGHRPGGRYPRQILQ